MIKVSTHALLLSLIFSTASHSQPLDYYAPINNYTSQTLRQTLHTLISSNHTRLPYTSSTSIDTWNVLESAQEYPLDTSLILDIYYNALFQKYGSGNPDYEREHAWPKSYGFPNDLVSNYPYTDCHNLFLSYSPYNSSRGNTIFEKCSACTEKPTVYNYGHGGSLGTYPGESNWRIGTGYTGTWEVWYYRRGDIARALLYMDVRYEGGINAQNYPEPDLILTNDRNLIQSSNTGSNELFGYMGLLSTLIEWNYEDPVNDFECQHNDTVYTYQGNRNPFVDHPEWVPCVFQGINCGIDTVFIDGFESGNLAIWAEGNEILE